MRIEQDDGLSKLLTSKEETQLCTGFQFTERGKFFGHLFLRNNYDDCRTIRCYGSRRIVSTRNWENLKLWLRSIAGKLAITHPEIT